MQRGGERERGGLLRGNDKDVTLAHLASGRPVRELDVEDHVELLRGWRRTLGGRGGWC